MTSDVFPSTSMPDRDWWVALWPEPESMLSALGVHPGMRALDLCCGDGLFTAPLARMLQGRVIALDIDPNMIELAQAEVAKAGAQIERWLINDARHLADLIGEPLDFVLIANTFHGVPDQLGLARAVASILMPGGLFAVVNWHAVPREATSVLGQPRGPRTEMRLTPEAVRNVVTPAGFRNARVVELPPFHYGSIFERDK